MILYYINTYIIAWRVVPVGVALFSCLAACCCCPLPAARCPLPAARKSEGNGLAFFFEKNDELRCACISRCRSVAVCGEKKNELRPRRRSSSRGVIGKCECLTGSTVRRGVVRCVSVCGEKRWNTCCCQLDMLRNNRS
jgi:hypothetical protein